MNVNIPQPHVDREAGIKIPEVRKVQPSVDDDKYVRGHRNIENAEKLVAPPDFEYILNTW